MFGEPDPIVGQLSRGLRHTTYRSAPAAETHAGYVGFATIVVVIGGGFDAFIDRERV